jgi:hypothetical protein
VFPFAETVTRIRPPAVDAYGDPVAGDADELDIDGWVIAPLSSTEDTDRAETVASGFTLYRYAAADVLPTDQLRIRGDVHEVVGRVRVWSDVGIELETRRVTG